MIDLSYREQHIILKLYEEFQHSGIERKIDKYELEILMDILEEYIEEIPQAI